MHISSATDCIMMGKVNGTRPVGLAHTQDAHSLCICRRTCKLTDRALNLSLSVRIGVLVAAWVTGVVFRGEQL